MYIFFLIKCIFTQCGCTTQHNRKSQLKNNQGQTIDMTRMPSNYKFDKSIWNDPKNWPYCVDPRKFSTR